MKNVLYFFIASALATAVYLIPKAPIDYQIRSNSQSTLKTATNLPVFNDKTIEYGIVNPHRQSSDTLKGLHESFGSGACIFDYNNDGWMDLFLINGSGQRHFFGAEEWWQTNTPFTLYKNTGLNRFEDATESALDKNLNAWGMGCAAADLDNDGDQDLIITNYGENLLLNNNGEGKFINSTTHSNITGDNWSTSVLTADFNRDGLLDIYILNFIKYEQGLKTYEASSGYNSETPPQFNPSLFDSVANKFYVNKGDLKFQDQTESAGLNDISGRGISAEVLDVNNDGYPDIFIANGQGTPNKLFLNNRGLNFSDVSESYNISSVQQSTGSQSTDFNNDGNLDLLVGTNNQNSKLLYKLGKDAIFSDIAKSSGLDKTETSGVMTWGVNLSDLNNDGNPDVFLANGFTTPDLIAPRKSQGQPNTLLINSYTGFKSCDSECFTFNNIGESSRSIVPADFDNDGDTDLFITQNNSLGQLLINSTGNENWLGIDLVGNTSNRDALGSKITLKTETKTTTKFINNSGFLSSHDKRVIFHLGSESAKSLSIEWPSGKLQTFTDLSKNSYISIQENFKAYKVYKITPNADQQSRIDFIDKTHKIEVIKWLNANKRKKDADFETSLILDSNLSNSELKYLLDFSDTFNPQTALKIFLFGIKNSNPDIRLLALKKLRQAEEEISSRFLLNLFNDPSPLVRCEISNTYQQFFHEEEAMIHSKYLAIPNLIHALSDVDENVIICAINALSESETHRAVEPLMNLISTPNQKESIRAKAISALGHLREKKSAALLFNILHDPNESNVCRYLSLGALKRLNAIEEDSFFKENFNTYYRRRADFEKFLSVLLDLSNDTDVNVIINPTILKKNLIDFKNKNQNTLSASENRLIEKIISSRQDTKKPKTLLPENPVHGDMPLTAIRIKELQGKLANLSIAVESRKAIFDDIRIKRLFSTRKIAKTIASNNQDPLQEKASIFLIETAKNEELSMYKTMLRNGSIPETQRFIIATGLVRQLPEFVLDSVLIN